MRSLLIGDIHGEFRQANKIILKAQKRYGPLTHVFQPGDLADGWPRVKVRPAGSIYEKEEMPRGFLRWNPVFQPIHWCDGNHENFDRLDDPKLRNPKLNYQERGSVLEVDGIRIMFFGGATSADKAWRTTGKSWWPQESIRYEQVMAALREELKPIHCIVSHDRPDSFPHPSHHRYAHKEDCGRGDRQALDALLDFYRPKWWFHGHYHDDTHGHHQDTNTFFYCCPIITSGKYLIWDGDQVIQSGE